MHADKRLNLATGEIKPPGLFLLSRQCNHEYQNLEAEGVSVAAGFQEVVLLASTPLSTENWQALSEGDILAVSSGKIIGKSTSV